MVECPCRWCKDRNPECHSNCEKYIEWNSEMQEINERVRENKRIAFLSRDDRPKRRR